MQRSKIIFQRITATDGSAVAEARSEVRTMDGETATTHQTVTVSTTAGSFSSHSSSHSSSQSTAR